MEIEPTSEVWEFCFDKRLAKDRVELAVFRHG
jgi:hypothetical protein